MSTKTELSQFLLGWRMMRGKSQRDLASEINVSHSLVAHAESDRFELPIEYIKKLAPLLTKDEKKRIKTILVNAFEKQLEFL